MSYALPQRSTPIYRDFDHEYRTAPPHYRPWLSLCDVAPELRRFHDCFGVEQKRPPRPLSNATFVNLAASFADPVMRAVLRKLIANLLKPVIREVVLETLRERNP